MTNKNTNKKGKEPYPGATKNLIPIKKGQTDIPRKGGQSKSPAKQLASRINGILGNKKLDPTQTYILQLMKDKNYLALANEFITLNSTEGYKDPERRDKVIAQLQAYMPKTNLNYNVNDNQGAIDIIFNILNNNPKWKDSIPVISEALKERTKQ